MQMLSRKGDVSVDGGVGSDFISRHEEGVAYV